VRTNPTVAVLVDLRSEDTSSKVDLPQKAGGVIDGIALPWPMDFY